MVKAPKSRVKVPPLSDQTIEAISALGALGEGTSNVPDIVDDPSWVRSSGKTPLEFLTAVYRHPLVRLPDRISAAKSVMEYTHRKMPSSIEMTGKDGSPLRVSGAMLMGLSDAELETMEALLDKAARAAQGM
jgi:hypothetical protein